MKLLIAALAVVAAITASEANAANMDKFNSKMAQMTEAMQQAQNDQPPKDPETLTTGPHQNPKNGGPHQDKRAEISYDGVSFGNSALMR